MCNRPVSPQAQIKDVGPDYSLINLMVNACPVLPIGATTVNLQTREIGPEALQHL